MSERRTLKLAFTALVTLAVLSFPKTLLAAKPDTSPTMAYLGIGKEQNIEISDYLLKTAEKKLRADVQMRPYEVFDLLKSGSLDIDSLMKQISVLVSVTKSQSQDETSMQNSVSSEQTKEKTPEKKNPDWADKLRQLQKAGYAYSLHLTKFKVTMGSKEQKVTVQMAAGIEIYKLNLAHGKPPSYDLVVSITKAMPAVATGTLREQGALEQQMAPVVRKVADKVGKFLGMEIRKLPEFQAQATVKSGNANMLVIPMGKDLGVQLDDAFKIFHLDKSGVMKQVAWAKARKIDEDSSQAEIILSDDDWSFRGDEIAVEHESSGISLLASAIAEVTGGDLLDRSGPGVYPGAELGIWVDLAHSLDIPEMHLLVNLDFVDIGRSNDPSVGVFLGHATIGLAKKWTFHRLALWFGMRVGFSYYLYSESSLQTQQDKDIAAAHVGFGGDAIFGMEVKLMMHFSLFAQFAGRVFSNPIDWLDSYHMEAGGEATAGLLIDF